MGIAGNLLSDENEGLETGSAPWIYVNDANLTSVASSSAQAYAGTKSALVILAGGGNAEWITDGANAVVVLPNTQYTFSVRMRARDNARNMKVEVNQFTGGFAFVSSTQGGAGTAGSTTSVPTSSWVTVYLTFTTGATTALAALGPLFADSGQNNSGEGFYVDFICIRTDATIPTSGSGPINADAQGAEATGTANNATATAAGAVNAFATVAAATGTAYDAVANFPAVRADTYEAFRPFTLDQILNGDAGAIRASAVFSIVDQNLVRKFDVTPASDSPPTITVNTSFAIIRRLEGLELTPIDEAVVDVWTHRLKVWWRVWIDGDHYVDSPLGVFVFEMVDRNRQSYGIELGGTMGDQSMLIDKGIGQSFAVPYGSSIRAAVLTVLSQTPIPDYLWRLDDGDATCGVVDLAWPADTSRLEILGALFRLLGWYPPYFNNDGYLIGRSIPLPFTGEGAQHVYGAGVQSRQYPGTMHDTTDISRAYDRYKAVGVDALGIEIVGVYNVADTAPVIRIPGVTSQAQADTIAAGGAVTAWYAYFKSTFESWPDPRHDVFDVVAYFGLPFREVGWRLTLATDGPHAHELARVY